jgi:hypothetical protein
VFFVHRSFYGMRIQAQEATGVHRPVEVRA